MASDLKFVEYVRDQMSDAGSISFRKMFGEYAIYCNEKVVALVCDNQLFVKPTSGGRSLIESIVEVPPYPGAKTHFLIDERIDDKQWISNLIRTSEKELPTPKAKNKKPASVKR